MRRSKKIWNFYLWFLKKMLIVHVRLEYLLVNYYDVPVDSTKDKVSVSGSISQGKDFFIDFLESFLIDDSVGTLLLKGSVEGTYFSCNELKWATVEQIQNLWPDAQCLKIIEKSHIASEASSVFIFSGQKFIKNANNSQFWRDFENLKFAVIQCYQTRMSFLVQKKVYSLLLNFVSSAICSRSLGLYLDGCSMSKVNSFFFSISSFFRNFKSNLFLKMHLIKIFCEENLVWLQKFLCLHRV